MSSLPIKASYDGAADVLYLTVADLAEVTDNNEVEEGLVFRYGEESARPVGATIIDCREYWLPKQREHLTSRLADFFKISRADARRLISVQ